MVSTRFTSHEEFSAGMVSMRFQRQSFLRESIAGNGFAIELAATGRSVSELCPREGHGRQTAIVRFVRRTTTEVKRLVSPVLL
jgi:hypothetical protein